MSNVRYEQRGRVRVITIDAPATLNAITMEEMDEMVTQLHAAEKDSAIGAVVITGTGRAFCTGSDLKHFAALSQEEIIRYCGYYGEHLFNYIATMGKAVIAAVNGYALGGGFELALACDLRLGTEKTQFGTPEFSFGWLPGWGGVARLAALIGPAKAKEHVFLQTRIKGPEALACGLISEMAAPEKLLDRAVAVGEQIADLNPLTVSAAKMVIRDTDVPQQTTYFQGYVCSLTAKMPYAVERVQAFFDRKKNK